MTGERAPIEGRLRMTEEDVLGGQRRGWPFLRWLYLAAILALAAFGVASGWPVKAPLQFFPFVGLHGFILVLTFFGPKWSARKTARALRLDEGDVTFRLDEEGMTMHAPGATSSTAYRAIPAWREVKSAFLLSCGPDAASIVPKRAFAPGDVERVRALLAANIKVEPPPGRKALRRGVILWVGLILAFLVVWQLFKAPQARRPRPTTSEPEAR